MCIHYTAQRDVDLATQSVRISCRTNIVFVEIHYKHLMVHDERGDSLYLNCATRAASGLRFAAALALSAGQALCDRPDPIPDTEDRRDCAI